LQRSKKAIRLFTNSRYSAADKAQLQKTIKRLIATKKVTTARYAKPIAIVDVLRDIVYFMWAYDEY
jgi:hypothetical protein